MMADVLPKKNIKKLKPGKKAKNDGDVVEKKDKYDRNLKKEKSDRESIVKKKKQIKSDRLDTIEDESEFKLADILDLGGEKDDYVNLLQVDENEEIETGETDGDITKLKNEVQNFMEAIGFESELYDEPQNNNLASKEDGNVEEGVKCKKKVLSANNEIETNSEDVKAVSSTKRKRKNPISDEPLKNMQYQKYDRLLLKKSLPWYELTKHIPKAKPTLYENEVDNLHTIVKQYWETEVEIYQKMKENDRSSDAKWLRTVLTSGTLSDKVAALTMLSQESPVHSMKSLDALMNMSRKKARREALIAIDSLRHIWIADLLPDYKLRKFDEFPLQRLNEYTKMNSRDEKIRFLITMAFEESLKQVYSEFVEILKSFSKDTLADIRNKVLGIVYELLQMKPEQEQALLSILVNKLGDPERKVASKASYLLRELVIKHPNMKTVVIKEVERMMYRPNMSDKAQYYAICFLNQIVLSHQEKETASKLISIYFSFFKLIVSREGKSKSKKSNDPEHPHKTKLLSGLLTGVNRAYPYVEGMDEAYDDQLNTLFKLTHMKHFSTSIQAFMLIYQVMESRQSLSDRYYQALYAKLLDPEINTSKHTMFLNLLYKSMKNDPVLKRVKAFIKRLLQVCSQYKPSLLCGVLYLISEVIKSNPGINSMMAQAEDDEEEERYVDAPLDEEIMSKFNSSDDECENKEDSKPESKGKGSWTFINQNDKNVGYNANHRNPLYAGADKVCLWEIFSLLSNFHPSVVHFATSVVNMKAIEYQGDPSQDFTLISFLDRFMYRNPKQKDVDHGSSLMQRKEPQRHKEQPVNSKQFLQKSEENIPCDQVFFYRYFKQKMSEKDISKEDTKDDVYDTEFVDVDDIDFAGEMKRDGEMKRSAKQKSINSDSESDEEDAGDDDLKFDYDDIDDDSSGGEGIEKENYTDKDYEDALFQNLDSDGESINSDGDEADDNNDAKMDPMFADAEEFAHMLDGDDDDGDGNGVHHKQIQWEEKQNQQRWKDRKGRNKGNIKRKKNFKENRNTKRKKARK